MNTNPAYYNFPRPEVVARIDAKNARILDVGCAAGAMGAELLSRGALEVVGIERENQAAQIARARLSTVYQLDLNTLPNLPYPDGYFDYITCADVLEHLIEPSALLVHLRRYLREGGTLVCSIPNIRHESVLVPLLVDGRFPYADAGILDRTHLRFYTIKEIAELMSAAGFEMDSQVEAVSSAPSKTIGRLAETVSALGGDAKMFKTEASVIQYVVKATPKGARPTEPNAVPRQALANQWSGSKAVRVLLAPELDNPNDTWLEVLNDLLVDPVRSAQITIGIAVKPNELEAPPQRFTDIARTAKCDLLLTEAPTEPFAWERLMAGATVFIDTGGRSALMSIARRIGVEVHEQGKVNAAVTGGPAGVDTKGMFLELMKRSLLNTIYEDKSLNGSKTFESQKRNVGLDWPSQAHTMIGRKRLDNLQYCMETALAEGIAGDFIETGVWRGGATIFMRAVLKAWGLSDRRVFVADSFEGLPKPNEKDYPADANDKHYTFTELAISMEEVKSYFDRYSLLDEQVVFLKGWFKDTLPTAPIEKLAVARLDGDMYESTMDAIKALYPKLSVGGFLIVDDFGAVPACRQAIEDYRKQHAINEPIHQVDWTGVYWRKNRDR